MNVKKLIIIISIVVVCIIGIVILVVNMNKEPIKIISTELSKDLGYSIAKGYYDFSEKNKENYYGIDSVENVYNSLINEDNTVLISTLPNKDILNVLSNKGVEIEQYPIAKDAIVFINNKINEVNSLKSEDIKKIYSKSFKNWNEVGGDDLDIIAYQSKAGGDLYYVLKNFMGDFSLENPKIRLQDESLGGLLTAITKYLDTRKSALGYINYNAIKNIDISDEIRILKLDNILPDIGTIYLDEYPGVFNYYLIVRKDMLENSQVKKLVEYIKSEEGQAVINGY